MLKKICMITSAALLAATPAVAERVKIGYVSVLSGPLAMIGNDMRDAFELALDHKNRKLGGLDVEVIYADDQMKPEVGKQATEKFIQSDKVDFLTGYPFSNVLLASLKPAVDAETFVISNNAGPSQLAGEACSPWFFTTSWQNDQKPMAMGKYLTRKGVKRLFVMSPNYAGGKDMAAGVLRTFKGEVAGEVYTRWPGQLDFSAELSKLRNSGTDAVWIFYAGGHGVQFFSQYTQAGLKLPVYSNYSVDYLTLPLIGEAALGSYSTETWGVDIDNPTNRRFVDDFRKKYSRTPSGYASQAYDGALLLDAAIAAVKGNLKDKNGLRNALRLASFEATRGPWKFGKNHFPIQNIYLQQVVKQNDGSLGMKTVEMISENDQDIFHGKCPMKW